MWESAAMVVKYLVDGVEALRVLADDARATASPEITAL